MKFSTLPAPVQAAINTRAYELGKLSHNSALTPGYVAAEIEALKNCLVFEADEAAFLQERFDRGVAMSEVKKAKRERIDKMVNGFNQ